MKLKNIFLILLFLGLAFRLFLSVQIYSGDINNHIGWANSILQQGPAGVYDREFRTILRPNYPPLALLSFVSGTGLYHLSYMAVKSINENLSIFPSQLVWAMEDQDVLPAFNKIFSILCDLGIGVLLYYFSRRLGGSKNGSLVVSIVYLFSPLSWYISSLWGQVDTAPLFFILLSLKFICQRRNISSHASFVAAILTKQIWPIFFPFFLLLWLKRFGIKGLISGSVIELLIFFLVNLPFSNSLSPLWSLTNYFKNILFTSGSTYISDHAFNFWALFSHLAKISENNVYFANVPSNILSAVVIGILVMLLMVKLLTSKTFNEVNLVFSSIALTSFLFLTKMHERHLAYAIPFILLTVNNKKINWLLVLSVSVVHLANLYHDWYFPRITPLDTFVASWTTIQSAIYILLASWIWLILLTFKKRNV